MTQSFVDFVCINSGEKYGNLLQLLSNNCYLFLQVICIESGGCCCCLLLLCCSKKLAGIWSIKLVVVDSTVRSPSWMTVSPATFRTLRNCWRPLLSARAILDWLMAEALSRFGFILLTPCNVLIRFWADGCVSRLTRDQFLVYQSAVRRQAAHTLRHIVRVPGCCAITHYKLTIDILYRCSVSAQHVTPFNK